VLDAFLQRKHLRRCDVGERHDPPLVPAPQRDWVEVIEALPPPPPHDYNARVSQHAKVLHDRETAEVGQPRRQVAGRSRTTAQVIQDLAPHGIAQGSP
jgi:hypothetical protein